MTYSRRMRLVPILVMLAIALAIVLAVSLAAPRPAGAEIHEIIGALCNGKDRVVPPGQVREGASFLRALQASGFITNITFTPTLVTINFDPDVPNSKFKSVGGNVFLEDELGPGVDLLLIPGVEPDSEFAAFASCPKFPF